MQDEMFNDFDELVASVKGWIASKTRQFFTRGIDKWEAIQNFLAHVTYANFVK